MDFLWFLEGIRTPALTKLFEFFTLFGEELIAIGIICVMYWCVNKKLAYRIAFTYFTAGLLVQSLKIIFRIPRPWVLDPSFKPVPSALGTATGYSFPSGHTQSAASLFGALALSAGKRLQKLICVLVFVLVGFSRMYLGVHTPKDVLTAMILSLAIALLTAKIMSFVEEHSGYERAVLLVLMAITVGVTALAFTLYSREVIDAHYVSDCLKAAGAGLGFAIGWYIETTRIHFSTRTQNKWLQIPKAAAGLTVAIALRTGLKTLLGPSPAGGFIRYFILVLWVVVVYPILLKRLQND